MIALLDTLLPGGEGWPAAGALGLATRMEVLVAAAPGGAEALARVLDALPRDFAALAPESREATLREVEACHPAAFETVLSAAYAAYYTDGRVCDVIARRTGFPDRPPQPLGHPLPPFDMRALEAVQARGATWRRTD